MTWGIWQIFTRALESVKIETLMGSFCPKVYELKIYSYVLWQWRMIQKLKKSWLVILKLTRGTSQILTQALQNLRKNCVLNGSLWPKHILFELQKYRGVSFHDTEELCKFWRKTDLWFEKRLEKFGKFSLEHLKVSKLGLWQDPFVQRRKGMT